MNFYHSSRHLHHSSSDPNSKPVLALASLSMSCFKTSSVPTFYSVSYREDFASDPNHVDLYSQQSLNIPIFLILSHVLF